LSLRTPPHRKVSWAHCVPQPTLPTEQDVIGNAYSLQEQTSLQFDFGRCRVGWKEFSELALKAIDLRDFRIVKAKEAACVRSYDEEKLLFLDFASFPGQNHNLTPVGRLGWGFSHIECLARRGHLHPRL
jgi:hypothetical protein